MRKPQRPTIGLVLIVTLLSTSACNSSFVSPIVNDHQNHTEQGYDAFIHQDYDSAIEELTVAIKGSPSDGYAYCVRGYAYYNRYILVYNATEGVSGRDIFRAIDDLTKAIELGYEYAEVYNTRGPAYATLGVTDQALGDYDTAVKLDSTLATVYYGRGHLYEDRGERELAIADYTRFLELSDDPIWRAKAEKRLKVLRDRSQ